MDGEELVDTVAKEAVARFQEWISDVPRLKELRFKRYEPGHLERVAIFGDASQTGIGVVAYLIKNDNGVRHSHIFYSKSTLMPKNLCFPILHVAEMWKRGNNNLIQVD